MIHFVHKGRNQHVIRHETVTQLNYRMAIPARSDFYVIPQFPEVYHGQGISKAPKSAAARRVTGECRNTTYSVIVSQEHRYILCFRAAGRRCME
ncbi:TPA: hypothetical protein ACRGEP_005086, partial [Klebsiella pneumoniae]